MYYYNCQIVCNKLGLPKGSHRKLLRYLYALENMSSPVYNPVAAKALKKVLESITINLGPFKKQRDIYTTLLLNNIEAMLAQVFSVLASKDSAYDILFSDLLKEIKHGDASEDSIYKFLKGHNTCIEKHQLEELVNSSLFGRKPKTYDFVDNFRILVDCESLYADSVILTAAAKYLKQKGNGTECDEICRKIRNEIAGMPSDNHNSTVYNIKVVLTKLVRTLETIRNENNLPQSESFAIIFKILGSNIITSNELLNDCIKARNKAAHGTIAMCPNHVIGTFLLVLIYAFDVVEYDEEFDKKDKIRARMLMESTPGILKDLILSIPSFVMCSYIVLLVISLFIGRTDLEKVEYKLDEQQLKARLHEAIGQKDTTTVLEIQHDLKWIENLHQQIDELNSQKH